MGSSPWGGKRVRRDFVTKNNNIVYLISYSYSLPLCERKSGATLSEVAPLSLVQVIAPTNAEVLPILPEPESLELKKHLKQVGEEGSQGRGAAAAVERAGLLADFQSSGFL